MLYTCSPPDALLADLQSTTSHISAYQESPPVAPPPQDDDPESREATPPPLPPPPRDVLGEPDDQVSPSDGQTCHHRSQRDLFTNIFSVANCKRPHVLNDPKNEDSQKLRPGCPSEYQILCQELTQRFSS